MTTKLSTMQITILTTASQRTDGSLLPLPDTQKMSPGLRRSISSLITRGLAAEGEGEALAEGAVWRTEGDRQLRLRITDEGRTAIGAPLRAPSATAAADVPSTKIAQVTALLRRAGGATVDDLISATGWLPHTTRAALTGLRKKGHSIEKAKRDGKTTYMIAAA